MIGERIAHYEIVEQLVNVVTAGCSLLAAITDHPPVSRCSLLAVANSNLELRPSNGQKLAASREPSPIDI